MKPFAIVLGLFAFLGVVFTIVLVVGFFLFGGGYFG